MKSKRQEIEEILVKFSKGYPKAESAMEIYNLFYPTVIDVFDELNPKFSKTRYMLISAERVAEIWLETNPAIGRMDPVPFLFKTVVIVALDGNYNGNVVQAEVSAEETMDLKLDAIADLLIENINKGKFK